MTASQTPLWFLNTRVSILIPASAGTDGLSVLKHWAPFGDTPPLHVHDTEDEVFHILEGTLDLVIDGQPQTAGPGATLIVPKGVPHSYLVTSPEGAKWLTVTRPGDFEAFVRAAARPATAAGLPEPAGPPSPEARAELAALSAAHGIRLVGPPLSPAAAA